MQQVWDLMSPPERRSALALLGMMILGTVLETLGIGLVIPALSFISQGSPLDRKMESLLGAASLTHSQLLVTTMVVLVGTYAVKSLYLAFAAWRQARFAFSLQHSLSRRLFEGYLRQPYTFHLQHNSAQMIRNVVSETSQFSHVATIPGMTLMSEGLILIGICALLFAIEPLGALLVMVLVGLAGFAFHHFTRARIFRWGEARQHHEGKRIQHLQQGLGGVKEVKLSGREPQFLAQYLTHDYCVTRVQERQLTLQALPRLWLEFLAVAGLVGLVLTMLGQGKPSNALISTLGLFAAAAFRIMPSVSKVLTSIQSLRYAQPVVNALDSELSLLEGARVPEHRDLLPFCHTLQLDKVSYCYPGAVHAALTDVHLVIHRGTSVGFVGGSGAGKSTLVDVILGLLSPTRGAIRVDGVDIQSNLRGWQSQIGYVPQNIYLTDDSVRSNVAFGLPADQIDEHAVWRALRAAQLEEFVRSLPEGLETYVGERGVRLSGGQRQRIGIARALYHDPPILVLDEATSSLDAATEHDVMEAVRALHGEKTILIVAHRIATVEHCDMVVRLARGAVVETGEPRVILVKTS